MSHWSVRELTLQRSRQNRVDHMPVDIAPITIDVVVATSQLSVVDAQQVQNRDVQVITPRRIFRRLQKS